MVQVKGSNIGISRENKESYQKDEENDEEYNQEDKDEENNKVKINTWNHLAFVYDSSASKKILIYLNCLLIGSSDTSLPLDLFKDQFLYLGHERINADITELRFWNKSLTVNDIKE
jgi:hypothetical protein